MLARVGDLECVADAEVDHRGEYLRVGADEACLDAVRRVLAEAGYAAERVVDANAPQIKAAVTRWYTARSVSELSREEASALAAEIAPAFLDETGVPVGADELRGVIASALADVFTSHSLGPRDLPNTLVRRYGPAVAAAASSLLGPNDAERLGRFVDERLSRYSRPDGPEQAAL